jgi:hypothetical protein
LKSIRISPMRDGATGKLGRGALREEHDAGFEEHDTGFEEHDTGFEEHDTGFEEHDTGFEEHDAGFEEHDTGFEEHDTGFEERDARRRGVGRPPASGLVFVRERSSHRDAHGRRHPPLRAVRAADRP